MYSLKKGEFREMAKKKRKGPKKPTKKAFILTPSEVLTLKRMILEQGEFINDNNSILENFDQKTLEDRILNYQGGKG